MNLGDFPAPKEGFVITHVLVVADPDRSRDFYSRLARPPGFWTDQKAAEEPRGVNCP
jgi:hypothetical protein